MENPETLDPEEKKNRLYSRISFWVSLVLSIIICFYYYQSNPPDEGAAKEMRIFIAKNARQVTEFLRLPLDEKKSFVEKNKHPFYKNYLEASEVTKMEIDAIVHTSTDYKPSQYWVNLVFLWVIFFAAFWFIGLMTEAIIQLTRQEKKERRKKIREKQKDF
tara:strand:- start:510 stop:992 length:483 start_codon:yes stop_codon:yes gene_type:complete